MPEDEIVRDYAELSGDPPPLNVVKIKGTTPFFQLPSARLLRNIILVLLAAILLWLAAYMRPLRREHGIPLIAILAVAVTFLAPYTELHAAEGNWQQRAYQAYEREAYQDARQWYARVPGYPGRMGEGSSSYQLGKYDHAVRQFVRATLDANSDPQRADALFNLANTYFKLSRFQEAVAIYGDALRYRPQDEKITRNLAYAQALLKKAEERADTFGRPGTGPR